ncbi:hypothetical protein CGRA01v4_00710 [Colletotrichum graminicola]|uniref:Uncharacterized protein n=1 Tax=Colletotrichum graminicola (strain M1.001 / M2 / FGSC 10212) TaxID=645133 RepID=E3QMW2_COLGM|nr:uncharacterized protein GLRG_07344 [Colletotrichum graminicola M1.001]EFQ32200.1 hypothetical protein GLRG_07344 [Colletotrichum graminicola M1.001]WDK09432.1 hypothetical protein CGRA01v4_00710 [Colletotrichum graminicola]
MLYNMGYPRDQSAVPAAQSVKPMVAPARPRQRCSQPMPFDPEELSQKLAKVLADQRLHAERRRRTRAEATVAAATGSTPAISQAQDAHPTHAGLARGYLEKGSLKPGHSITRPGAEPPVVKPTSETAEPTSARLKSKASDDDRRSSQSAGKGSFRRKAADVERHHFIPQFAASQFTRTTTAENMSDSKGLVRKLSRTALRLAQGHRERHQERANVQREQMPEIAEMGNARAYGDRNHRHTIEGTLGAGRTAEMRQARGTRPVSTGDLLMAWDSEAPSPCPDDTTDIPAEQNPYEHRVDWTQSDEIQPQPKPKPSLRRADSIWALKNKLGAFTKHGRDENHSRETSPPSDVSRSPKGGFFSRFKVNH